MASSALSVLVLAAGKGTRMRSDRPKVLHEVGRRSLLHHVLATATALDPQESVVVIGPGMEDVAAEARRAVPDVKIAVQESQLGTGDAVKAALPKLSGRAHDVLVLYGDCPFIRAETIRSMAAVRGAGAGIVVLGFRPKDPARYGRLVTRSGLELEKIVEFKDASPAERAIDFCNSGIFLIDGERIGTLIGAIKDNNAQREYYLTDIVEIGRGMGLKTMAVEGDPEEVLGINSRAELAGAEAIFQRHARAAALEGGVTMIDPNTVYFSADTKLGRDIVIQPHCVFGPGVTVEDDVRIEGFCHFEGAHIKRGGRIGPFARLRPGAKLAEDVHIGNFVEIKNAVVDSGAKINHLTYIGDAHIGTKTNVGAGTITSNYDGFDKYRTEIGANVFIGSHTSLVAPVKVGDGAYIGSSSVIVKDVPPDALVLTRAELVEKPGWAARFRARKLAAKQKAKE
ncbi:MAG: bifunctional UDP-N-acetylglucosamine diphosphorylase/glucosamine-1-phosphate N-acetyltransferase GlmU [Alphaproteobacteria bacterium]